MKSRTIIVVYKDFLRSVVAVVGLIPLEGIKYLESRQTSSQQAMPQ